MPATIRRSALINQSGQPAVFNAEGTALSGQQPGSPFNPRQLSRGCLFYLPWVRDATGNVTNKAGSGDALKSGSAAVPTQTRGWITTAAGTFAAGHRLEVPAGIAHMDLAKTFVLHFKIQVAAPGATIYPVASQRNASTPGVLMEGFGDGGMRMNIKPGNVQNVLPILAGVLDGTPHTYTLVVDRVSSNGTHRNAYQYLDSVLMSTTSINASGTPGTAGSMALGAYNSGASYAVQLAQVQAYSLPFDLADLNAQMLVDRLALEDGYLTADLVGY